MKRKTVITMMMIFSLFFLTGCDQLFNVTTTTTEEITTDDSQISTTTDSDITTTDEQITATATTTEQGELTQKLMFIYDLAVESGEFQGTYEEWLESVKGPQGEPGEDGREIVIQVFEGFVQWKYDNEESWNNLVEISTLVGPAGEDGKEVLFQVAEGYIQWQYAGDETWTNLIDLASLTGVDGSDGIDGKEVLFQVAEGYIQWQYTGDETWTNLIDLASLTGVDGSDGIDGKEVLFQVAEGYIQWQYTGDETWTNLIEINSLTGAQGISISNTSFNLNGELIITYSDGTEYNLGVPIVLYTVNFYDYNGYLLDTLRVSFGSEVIAPADPIRKGYTFNGWSKDTSNITGDIDVFAEYTINTYTVAFDTNTSEVIPNLTNLTYSSSIDLPILEMQGYRFLGWYLGETENSQRFFNQTLVEEDLILYAKWEKIEYKVNFLGFDGVLIGAYYFTIDDDIRYPLVPEIEGYRFMEWDKEFDFSATIMDIQAIYEPLYSIQLFGSDGNVFLVIEDVLSGDIVELPEAEKDYYSFSGWYNDFELNQEFSGVMPDSHLVLFPKFSMAPEFIGVNDTTIDINSTFEYLSGVQAFDDEDGFITNSINYEGIVDSAIAGDYLLTYRVIDSDGIETVKERLITVSESIMVYPTGMYNFKYADSSLRNTFMAAAEKYLLETLYGGIPLFQNVSYELFSDRVELIEETPFPQVGNFYERAYLNQDDSNIMIRAGVFGSANEYTFRTAINTENLPNSWNHWENNNQLYDPIYDIMVENLYNYSYDFTNDCFTFESAMAASTPLAVNGTTHDSGKVSSKTWQIPIKDNLTWSYHPEYDTYSLPTGHEVLDAYDFYETYLFALDQNWYQAVDGLYNFVDSYYAIKNAYEYSIGEVDSEDLGIRLIDNLTIELEFIEEKSATEIMDLFATYNLAPVNNEMLFDYNNSYSYDYYNVSYSGPYMFDYLHHGEYENDNIGINFVENPNYFAGDLFNYTNFYFNLTNDDLDLFNAGLLDRTIVLPSELPEYIGNPNLKVTPISTTFRLMINGLETSVNQQYQFPNSNYIPEPILANNNFRKAMYYAINRNYLVEEMGTGAFAQMHYYSNSYYVDVENGIPYRLTDQGLKVGQDFDPETFGFNTILAKAYFELALEELIADGIYSPGSIMSPNIIIVDLFIMTGSHMLIMGENIKEMFESVFVSDTYHVEVKLNVEEKAFPSIYYNHLMIGEFDLGFGGISGSELYASYFMDVFTDDNRSGFTLNWGIDTSTANIPVEYIDDYGVKHFEMWSYNAITAALNGEVYLSSGEEDILLTAFELLDIPQTEAQAFETMKLPEVGYLDKPIFWSVLSGSADINNNIVTFGNEESDFTVVLQAKIIDGNDSIYKDFSINVSNIPTVTDFTILNNITDGEYDIANGQKIAVSGIVTLSVEDLVLLTDINGNGVFVSFLEAEENLLGATMEFVGIVSSIEIGSENHLRYLDNDGYYRNVSGFGNLPIPISLTTGELLTLESSEYDKVYSYTGFEVISYNEYGEVILEVSDGTNTNVFSIYLENNVLSWFEETFPIGSILPEATFAIIYEYNYDNEIFHHLIGFNILEAEYHIDNYQDVFYGAFSHLESNAINFEDLDFNDLEVDLFYMQSILQNTNPENPYLPIIEDVEKFLIGIRDKNDVYGYNSPITKITYLGIEYEWISDETQAGSLWTEVSGTELLIDKIYENLENGNEDLIFTINDGSIYSRNLFVSVNIYKDYLYNYLSLLTEALYYTNENMVFSYNEEIVSLNEINLNLGSFEYEDYLEMSIFYNDFMSEVYQNQSILYYGEIDYISYNGNIYFYNTSESLWIDEINGIDLDQVVFDTLYQAWVVEESPFYIISFTITDEFDFSIEVNINFNFS